MEVQQQVGNRGISHTPSAGSESNDSKMSTTRSTLSLDSRLLVAAQLTITQFDHLKMSPCVYCSSFEDANRKVKRGRSMGEYYSD